MQTELASSGERVETGVATILQPEPIRQLDESLETLANFTVCEMGDFVWLLESDQPFAVFCRSQQSFDQFRFSRTDPCLPQGPHIIDFYHFATVLGARTTLRSESGSGHGNSSARFVCKNDCIEFSLSDNEGNGSSEFQGIFSFNNQSGAYDCTLHARFLRSKEVPIEAFNLYFGGLEHEYPGSNRPARPQYTVWRGVEGRLWKHPNSHAFSYLAVPIGRGKHLSDAGQDSFIGFGYSPGLNPLWRVISASPRIGTVRTCDMFFDQHLTIDTPGLEHRDEQGWFVSEMEIRIENLAEREMRQLVESARTVSLLDSPHLSRQGIALNVEGTATMDCLVEKQAMTTKPMAVFPSWHKECHALGFARAPGNISLLCLNPSKRGPSEFHHWDPHPTFPAHRTITLRISGEADGLDMPAEVGLCTTKFDHDDIVSRVVAEPIVLDGPWERTVSINNGIYNFVLPFFRRLGNGGLWIREISLFSEPV